MNNQDHSTITDNTQADNGLLPFIVLYTDSTFNLPEASLFQAEDGDHAEEQMLNENPDATVTWIVQTDDVDDAYNTYHKESSFED